MSNEPQRWHFCRACGMVKDKGYAHAEYGKYADQGPYWIAEADHARIVAEMEQAHAAALAEARQAGIAIGWRDPAAPRTLTADDRLAIARRVDAALAAMPTGFWINANTEEAQAHKRYVRDALAALIHDGGAA